MLILESYTVTTPGGIGGEVPGVHGEPLKVIKNKKARIQERIVDGSF